MYLSSPLVFWSVVGTYKLAEMRKRKGKLHFYEDLVVGMAATETKTIATSGCSWLKRTWARKATASPTTPPLASNSYEI
jgi:hypothetical protein